MAHTFKTSVFASGIDWSAQSDEDNWLTSDSGAAVFDGADPITGGGAYKHRLIIAKAESIHAMWLVVSDLIFNAAKIKQNIGSFSPHSFINGVDGELFFLASDKTIRVIRGLGSRLPVVSEPIWKSFWDIPDEQFGLVRGHYIRRYKHTIWAIPSGPEETANNILCVRDESGRWIEMDTAVTAFGRYRRHAGFTIDTIPYPTIDEIGWDEIDFIETVTGFRQEIVSDASGYTYNLYGAEKEGETSDYTGFFTLGTTLTTDSKTDGLLEFKRVNKVTLIFRGETTGTALLQIKADFAGEWTDIGTVTLTSTADYTWLELPCDLRFRHAQIKISATNRFKFVGILFHYEPDGQR